MCNQSVGLIQGVLEKAGLTTVSVTLLREVTETVKPPRALFVDLPLGYPLGRPYDSVIQKSVLLEALALFNDERPLPLLVNSQTTNPSPRRSR